MSCGTCSSSMNGIDKIFSKKSGINMNKLFQDLIDKKRADECREENGIIKFTEDISYSSNNFQKLRELHPQLQIDSKTNTTYRLNDILERSLWPAQFFRGKRILECGCGAGGDTEILSRFAKEVVAVDLTGLDIAKKNLEGRENVHFVQADISDLPFAKNSFDIVYCSRVIQHTPNPEKTLGHIMQFVSDGGGLYVNCYARTFYQMFRWKYVLRPITTRMNPDRLYSLISNNSRNLYNLSNNIKNLGKFGRIFDWIFIPFFTYRSLPEYKNKSDKFLIEYGIHDTFDALSPVYDNPLSRNQILKILSDFYQSRVEVTNHKTTIIIRTLHGND